MLIQIKYKKRGINDDARDDMGGKPIKFEKKKEKKNTMITFYFNKIQILPNSNILVKKIKRLKSIVKLYSTSTLHKLLWL